MKKYILQIDTSTPICSVAISLDGMTVAQTQADGHNMHAAALTQLISDLLTASSLALNQLSAISVSKGPGSYTGLRIGISVAKGLCYALDYPLIAVDSLQMLCEGFRQSDYPQSLHEQHLLCPMIDARRREVYQAIFTSSGHLVQPTSAAIIDEYSFDWLISDQSIFLFGSGADKFADLFASDPKVHVVSGFPASATYLSHLSFQLFLEGRFEDLAYFEPFYLKDFVPTTPKKKQF
ncbi:MAG TPA: tRNA (adenosine(37)-N6)-threonylcarbamoyltransferase complex dimerization subunit type 1 TsaB [Sphingobacteriaceae bacterium]|nr:tRNA (adenosine(37)-N6)-threonylcarbamoyltransferase complex dimerization subunit type 1 TsaB [Sphingobacteriaceae bacterium]